MTAADLPGIGFHEALEMLYLFDKPFRVDVADSERLLAVGATRRAGPPQRSLGRVCCSPTVGKAVRTGPSIFRGGGGVTS
jgi:hypothetical protein